MTSWLGLTTASQGEGLPKLKLGIRRLKHYRISPTDREKVESEHNKLMASFEKLQQKHGTKLKLGKESTLPDLTVILEGATHQQQQLREKSSSTKVGKAQGKLRSLCKGIRSHSNIARALPKDDKYICLFTGSVFTFIEVGSRRCR